MDTRVHDLEDLVRSRERASSHAEKEHFDRVIDKIARESGAVRKRREQLIMAVRNNDRRAVERFKYDLMMMEADKTYGKQY